MKVRIATRSSELAIAQANSVGKILQDKSIIYELVPISTQGDQNLERPLHQIGSKGLFTSALEEELEAETVDCAVHSLKDLPTVQPDNLPIVAVTPREIPWDCLLVNGSVGVTRLRDLPAGSRIGTSSLRRTCQLRHLRPDCPVVNLRGNLQTRLRKIRRGEDNLAAAVMARAGLARSHLLGEVAEELRPPSFLPAPGQGALAIQGKMSRLDRNTPLKKALESLSEPQNTLLVGAERVALAAVEGGCSTPFGAYAESIGRDKYRLQACIGNLNTGELFWLAEEASASSLILKAREVGLRLRERLAHS